MAYKITDACISCGACEAECPVSAISEGNGKYEINADTCIECGACAGVCPVGAPVAEYAAFGSNRKKQKSTAGFPPCFFAPLRGAVRAHGLRESFPSVHAARPDRSSEQ